MVQIVEHFDIFSVDDCCQRITLFMAYVDILRMPCAILLCIYSVQQAVHSISKSRYYLIYINRKDVLKPFLISHCSFKVVLGSFVCSVDFIYGQEILKMKYPKSRKSRFYEETL